ncbi:hypothetical protein ACFL4A_03005 [bacterium]
MKFIDVLNKRNIGYNPLIKWNQKENKWTVYIVMRKVQESIGFLESLGIVVARNDTTYNNFASRQDIYKFLEKGRLRDDVFSSITKEVFSVSVNGLKYDEEINAGDLFLIDSRENVDGFITVGIKHKQQTYVSEKIILCG